MKHIKNLVGKHGKKLKARAEKLGVADNLIMGCINGDDAALTKVGEMGNEGERILTIMPYITDNLSAFIKGTEEYNKGLAEIYKQAGASGIAIDKASADLTIANLKYGHERSEIGLKLSSDRTLENQRYRESIDLVKLKAYIDYHMSKVDHLAAAKSQLARPVKAQLDADRTYETEKAKHLLTYGEGSDLDLVPRKSFTTNKLVQAFRTAVSTIFE